MEYYKSEHVKINDINDHKIICEAEQLGKEVNAKILFLTSDGA